MTTLADFAQRFRKARKCYRDFPFLWAIEPNCSYDLEIKIEQLDGALVSQFIKPNTSWWVYYGCPFCYEEVSEVPIIEGKNLASEILSHLGDAIGFAIITHLISVEELKKDEKKITIYRPRKEGMTSIPIRDVCINRAC